MLAAKHLKRMTKLDEVIIISSISSITFTTCRIMLDWHFFNSSTVSETDLLEAKTETIEGKSFLSSAPVSGSLLKPSSRAETSLCGSSELH
jgi:precorrin-6B methylase 1